MTFNSAKVIQQIVYQCRLYEYPRAQNRARIDGLFNGFPPFSAEEIQDSLSATNCNFLESTTLAHNARKNFANALLKPTTFFSVVLDSGPRHKRDKWSSIITEKMNRPMKRSLPYFEAWRSTIASNVLHGIGPKAWPDKDSWRPKMIGVGDVMIPSGTELDMDNLPFFSIHRRYTAYQLMRLTMAAKRDPGWNMATVKASIDWAADRMTQLAGSQWADIWQPERLEEFQKENSGAFSGDQVPVIDADDFFYWSDEGKTSGWRRKIVLDPWGGMGAGGTPIPQNLDSDFLFDGGERVYGDSREQIIAFQFADLSSVAPLRYHSVRSLGFLLYAVCHLQNRLRCRLADATFESLMQFFRVKSDEDIGRALKINLIDKGVIDQSVQFVPANERWQVNERLVEMGIEMNKQSMQENSGSMVEDSGISNLDHVKASVYAGETQRSQALVGAALQQSYAYATFEYREIARRFCKANSKDPDVRQFRMECLKAGVPEDMLDVNRMDIAPEQVMGGGNTQLEQSIAQQLMQFRPLYGPQAQQVILRKSTLAITGDAALADLLVPEDTTKVSPGTLNAQRACGSLLLGLHVDVGDSENHAEVAQTVLGEGALALKNVQQFGGMPTMAQVAGIGNLLQYAGQHIQLLAQDKNSAAQAKQLGQQLSQLEKATQQIAKQVQQAQQQNGIAAQNGEAAKEAAMLKAKTDAIRIQATAKAESARESHSQRTAQKQTQWQMEQQRKARKHDQDLEHDAEKSNLEISTQARKDALDIAATEEKEKARKAKKE
jgi:hypothetical protein